MTIDTEDLLNSIMDTFSRMTYIKPEEVPNIDLYMDQVTTFMDERLKSSSRKKDDEEKLMTKTMINNYAKNDVIPPPIRKKYNKEHVLILIMIYYFKSILQINDIKDLMDPIVEKYFNKDSDFGIEEIYDAVFDDMGDILDGICTDVTDKYKSALNKFSEVPEDDREYLQLYSFVCMLGCDVFVRKLLIEKIVDSLKDHRSEKEDHKENKYDVTPDKKKK